MLIQRIERIQPVNLFLGAGVSKLAPSYAPTWREMQVGFCEALFDRMKAEKWDVYDVEDEIEQLRRFNFRPETLWERILENTSLGFVAYSFGIVNVGQPNLNHKTIAEWCRLGWVQHVVTTNFDEYLDKTLPPSHQRIINQQDASSGNFQRMYFKIHGSSSDDSSLQFTLKHTRQLPEWKMQVLRRCLSTHPLVIAGYSGWDDDIMPALSNMAPDIPRIIVVRHPGANRDEPIARLAKLPNVELVEADFSMEVQAWGSAHSDTFEKLSGKLGVFSAPKEPDLKDFYKRTIDKLDIPRVPFLTSLLFELAANRELAKKYAWLTDDACDDRRYQSQISADFRRQQKAYLSNLVAAKDPEFSRALMGSAHEEHPHVDAPIANSIMENVDRAFEYFQQDELTAGQVQEIEQYAMGALKLLDLGVIHGTGIKFRASWCMGRLRLRQKKISESSNFYAQAIRELPDGISDIQKCSFLLDCGLAAMQHSFAERNDVLLRSAVALLEESERIAVNINDHMTAAKAMMNLSNCYAVSGLNDLAVQKVKNAQRLAQLTGDLGLQARAANLEGQIIEIIKQLQ